MPDAEIYRDADTLGRLPAMIGAEPQALAQAQAAKTAAVAAMAGARGADTPLPHPEATAPAAPTSLFQIGDLAALRSNPSILMPIIEVVPGGAECRYRVFQDNQKATYYESQIQSEQRSPARRCGGSRGYPSASRVPLNGTAHPLD